MKDVPVAKTYERPSADGTYSKMRARDWLIAVKPLLLPSGSVSNDDPERSVF